MFELPIGILFTLLLLHSLPDLLIGLILFNHLTVHVLVVAVPTVPLTLPVEAEIDGYIVGGDGLLAVPRRDLSWPLGALLAGVPEGPTVLAGALAVCARLEPLAPPPVPLLHLRLLCLCLARSARLTLLLHVPRYLLDELRGVLVLGHRRQSPLYLLYFIIIQN
jgi:hypothetical protein